MNLLLKILQEEKFPGLGDFTDEHQQIFREEIILILHNSLQKIEEGTLPNLLSEAGSALMPKSDNDVLRKLYTQHHEHIH